jgi:hypothetical protein
MSKIIIGTHLTFVKRIWTDMNIIQGTTIEEYTQTNQQKSAEYQPKTYLFTKSQ